MAYIEGNEAANNVRRWASTIISDKQYDYEFLWVILRQKLHLQYQYFEPKTDDRSVMIQQSLATCLGALDRLLEDYPSMNGNDAEKHKQADVALLFDTMKTHVLDWWD